MGCFQKMYLLYSMAINDNIIIIFTKSFLPKIVSCWGVLHFGYIFTPLVCEYYTDHRKGHWMSFSSYGNRLWRWYKYMQLCHHDLLLMSFPAYEINIGTFNNQSNRRATNVVSYNTKQDVYPIKINQSPLTGLYFNCSVYAPQLVSSHTPTQVNTNESVVPGWVCDITSIIMTS